LVVAALGAMAAGLGGCRGDREDKPPRQFFPDLDDQPKWDPQGQTDFFVDGRTMRPTVPGTVAFSRMGPVPEDDWAEPWQRERDDFLRDNPLYYEGKTGEGTYAAYMPVEVTADLISRGQERFNIFCATCHGYTGDGKGLVGNQWSYPLPNFHDAKYKDREQQTGKDGYIYHVARYGIAGANPGDPLKMPGYKHALNARDSWAVVAYIRTLQASYDGTLADVPEARRRDLERTRPTAPVPADPASTTPPSPPVPTTPSTGAAPAAAPTSTGGTP
jgi:mono/diheme cytochrome c family protein